MIEPRMYIKKCFSDLVIKYGSIFGKDKTMTNKPRITLEGKSIGEYFEQAIENKKLKNKLYAKEQECEELKKEKQGLIKDWEEKKNLAYEIACKNEKLDTENKRLVAELANPVFDSFEEYDKLKQTLTEIKPILEYYANSTIGEEQEDGTYRIELSYKYGSSNMYGAPCYYKYNPKPAKQALQKISECEVEDE